MENFSTHSQDGASLQHLVQSKRRWKSTIHATSLLFVATSLVTLSGAWWGSKHTTRNIRRNRRDIYGSRFVGEVEVIPVALPTTTSSVTLRMSTGRSLQENNDTSSNCTLDCCTYNFEQEICATEEENDWVQAVPLGAQIVLVAVLLILSGLFSGLTLGFMSLDITGLEIVMAGDDPKLAQYAKDIYPYRKWGNLLLCTLIIGNTLVNSLLSIFFASITTGTIALVTSTALIVVFGEILPQAACSRYPLRVGSASLPIVKVIRIILFPFAYPLAIGLDWMLGRELATTYTNSEMMELLKIHVAENVIDQEAANAMTGALTYQNVTVKEAMTPMERTFMLGVDEKLSFETIGKIFKTGYSRIPIYEISRSNIIGILLVKDLIFIDPEDEVPIRSFIHIFGRNIHVVWPDDTLGEVLTELKKGRSHLAIVRDVNNADDSQDPFYEVKGIITLEDIVERILGVSIVDETDAFVDGAHTVKVEREGFEWARLRLLDTKIVDELLSASEVSAVTAHLRTNYSDCFKLLTDSQLTRLVSSTPVTTFPTATQDVGKSYPNELLYEKGVASDSATLILSGKVAIFVGSENFRADLFSWSVLGKAALENKSWVPDFTAYVSDGPCRFIQIHHDAFAEAVDASVVERRALESKPISACSSYNGDGMEESARSRTSSNDGEHVPNRRAQVLAKLFNAIDSKDSEEEPDRPIKAGTTVQFDGGDIGKEDKNK